jgi:hypothetical protein
MKFLLLFFKGFLLENFGYSVDLVDIAGLALTNILGVSSIFNIMQNDILLFIFFITNTKSYIFFISFGYCITKRNKTIIVMFG